MSQTIGDLLARACQRYGDRPAVVRDGTALTYAGLLDAGARLANALRGAGVPAGTPVAAMLEDRLDSIVVYVGAAIGGYPVIHVNDRLAAPEVAHILRDSGARVLFHTDGRSEVVAAAAADSAPLIVTIGRERPPGAVGLAEFAAAGSSRLEVTPRAPGDLAIVGYTSGTTGVPKGAMISQRALTDCVRLMPSIFRISSYGRCAFTGTLSFVSGLWGVIFPHLYTGGTITFLHPYSARSWADHLAADHSTFTYAPTPYIPQFAAELRRRPQILRSLESVIHSGSPVPRSQVEDLVDVAGERYVEAWGMTEGVAPFTATTRGDWRDKGNGRARDIFASAGRPFPSAAIAAVGRDGQALPPGEEGELTVTADIMFDGYLGDAAKTAASFGPHGFRTGDLGRLDEAGYVYVTGRARELIIIGGANVYPAEVEAALAALPGVAECTVLGLPDERWGEAVTAVIVTAAGARLTELDVIEYLRPRIAGFKRPQRVYFVESLPRNASLKVRKDVVRARLTELAGRAGQPDLPAGAELRHLEQLGHAALVAHRVAGVAGAGVDRHEVGVGGVLAPVERVQARRGDVPRILLAAVDVGRHPGVDRAHDQRGHLGPLVGQLAPGDAGEEERGRLGGRVTAHERGRVRARDRQHVDDVAAAVRPQRGGERPDHVQHPEVVHLHLAAGRVEVLGQHQSGPGEQPRVVDQQAHLGTGGSGGAHRGRVGDVEPDHFHREAVELPRRLGRLAHAGVDLARAPGRQLLHEGEPDPAVGPGDKGDRAGRFRGPWHACSSKDVVVSISTLQLKE